jgi:GGDEF domain-containing protein
MISIFSGSRGGSNKAGQKALRQLCEVLDGNLIRARGLNHAELAADLRALAEAVENAKEEPEVEAVSQRVEAGISTYFLELGRGIDSLGMELSTSIRALATLVHDNAGDQDAFLTRMESIRDKFQGVQALNDLPSLRRHLDTCLSSLRTELLEARKANEKRRGPLNEHLSKLHRSISALRSKIPPKHTDGPALSIIRVRRLKAVRDRYGKDVAQRMLDHLVQLLLVRWPAAYDITPYGEECLVVIDSENLDLDFHRAALRKLTLDTNKFVTQYEGRELALPIALDWTVLRAPADGDVDEFIRNFLDGMAQQDANTAALDKTLGLR